LNSAQTDTNKPAARDVWTVAVGVECHAPVVHIGRRCTEVGRGCITAPAITSLVTITRVTGNKEARIERMIADQQLVGVSVACSDAMPQSSSCGIPVVHRGSYGQVGLPLEVDFSSSLVINEDDFCEL